MPKKRKKFLKSVLFILVFVLISAGSYWYFNFYKKSLHWPQNTASSIVPNVLPEEKNRPTPVDWQSLIPEIRQVLKQEFSSNDIAIEERSPIEIVKTTDITGDGIPEALIDLGTGGAYTDLLTLMRIENGQPVVAILKDKNEELDLAPTFLQGASVRYGESLDMVPEKKAIYSGNYSVDDAGVLADCSVEAYQWNLATKTFDWSSGKSYEIKQSYCADVEKMISEK